MKNVMDHPEFAAASQLLADLLAEQQRIEAERLALFEQLQRPGSDSTAHLTHEDRARAMLTGEPLRSAADVLPELRDREATLRRRLEEIARLVSAQRIAVERARERAQAEAFEADARTAKVRAAWDTAARALNDALAAEDAIISDLIAGGFGWRPATITAAHWLKREAVH